MNTYQIIIKSTQKDRDYYLVDFDINEINLKKIINEFEGDYNVLGFCLTSEGLSELRFYWYGRHTTVEKAVYDYLLPKEIAYQFINRGYEQVIELKDTTCVGVDYNNQPIAKLRAKRACRKRSYQKVKKPI